MDGIPIDRYIDAKAQELGAQFDTTTANALRMLQKGMFVFWMWAVGHSPQCDRGCDRRHPGGPDLTRPGPVPVPTLPTR